MLACRRGGEIGKHSGLKIRRPYTACRFDSGPRHHVTGCSVLPEMTDFHVNQ